MWDSGKLTYRFVQWSLALSGVCVAGPAWGYCRTMTCELGEEFRSDKCERDANDCVTEGKPLHWASACLDYAVQIDGSLASELDADEIQALVDEAFTLWRTADCPGGGNPHFAITFQGFVSCHEKEYVCAEGANVNVVMFHDEGWPGMSNEIGLTTPSAGTKSGRIFNADIEFNAEDWNFKDASGSNSVAVFPVIAHEVGHFLGLGHSHESGALMSVDYRNLAMSGNPLTPDDVAGICAIYPPKPETLACVATEPVYDACLHPDPDAADECVVGSSSHEGGGCSVARRQHQPPFSALAAAVALLGFARRREFRKRRPRRSQAPE